MADIIVDVSLPNPITTDVTSPTQALATNISVPGPQGPTGPKGNPTTINSLSAENIIITGANGNIVSNDGISKIYISGNSGYFQSAVNTLTTNLENTGSNLYSLLTNFSGNLDANYASDAQLFTTGSTLDTKINSLSGYVDIQDNSILLNLNSTGSILDNRINSLSGYSASIVNLASTGSTLDSKINSLSGYSASINNLQSTGSNLYSMLIGFSGDLDATYATDSQLATTGSTLNNKINTLSGYTDSQDTTISNNLRTTGSTLDTKINNLSGYVNTQDNSISNNLTNTGITLNNKINSLSGAAVLKFDDQIIYGTKYFNEDVYIHNLYVTGDEFIANVTNNFVESPYLLLNITGGAIDGGIFFVTGSGFTGINDYGPIIGFDHSNKFKIGVARRSDDLSFLPDIASVQQIEAYSGVANNTFSTITNLALTGSTLNNKINSLSGNLTANYATITNLASTGSTLNSKINSLSGWSASAVNLVSTGSTLDSKINSLSGWSASAANLASTGSTLDSKINSLSGWSASAADLASTGSNLNNKINNLSGYINSSASNIVFTTGNQTISGVKTFVENTTFGDSAQGDFLVISGNQFTVYGSGNFTSGLFVNSSPVLTGSSTLYATTVNLASTGSTLDNKINNLSGVSVLRFGDQTISGVKTFIGNHNISGNLNVTGNSNIRGTLDVTGLVVSGLGTPFILKSASNANSVYFNSTQNGNAGALTSNYLYSIELGHIGDENLTLSYGGGGTRNITFRGGGANISRVILDSNGNFGIGSGISSVPSRFYVSGNSILQGNLTVSGHLSAASKSFLIDHPTVIGKKLQYGSLEGPEHGVFVRGKTNENIINLPNYWPALVDENSISVNLTPISAANNIYVVDYNNKRIITNGNNGNYYFYTVYGERKDIPKLTVEF